MKNKTHNGNKISIGAIVNFNMKDNSIDLSQKDLKKIYTELERIKTEEFNSYESLQLDVGYASMDKKHMIRDLIAYLDSYELRMLIKNFVELDKLSIIDAYNKAVATYIEESPIIFSSRYKVDTSNTYKHIDEFRSRIVIRLELYFLQEAMRKSRRNFILCVDEFKKEYLYRLPRKIQGIICKNIPDNELVKLLSSAFELPIIQSEEKFDDNDIVVIDGPNNRVIARPELSEVRDYRSQISQYTYSIGEQPTYADSKINIYVPLADTRFIEKAAYGDWYNGVAPFKTEYLYVTKGSIPTLEEQEKVFIELLEAFEEKDVYIRVPDFRPTRPTPYLGEIFTDKDTYMRFFEIYNVNLLALASAVKTTKKDVNIVIPMIRLSSEVSFWRDIVEGAFDMYDLPYAKLGIMIETESAFEYYEDYDDMDFVIIGLNDLVEELTDDVDRFTELTKDEMLEIFWPELRDLHQYLRSYKLQVKHIVAGNCLKNPEIFNKLLKSGFTDFSISINDIKLIEKTLKEYNESRGKFIGVAAHRIEKKVIAESQKAQKEADDAQAIIDKANQKSAKLAKKQQETRDKNKEKREIAIKKILSKKDNEEK